MLVSRKNDILRKLGEKAPSKEVTEALKTTGATLGFGAVKANKKTVQTVPGQEVLHSGGKWAQQALAQQEARIGVRPSVPTPGAIYAQKQASLSKLAMVTRIRAFLRGGGKTKKTKPLSALQRREVKLGLRNADGTLVPVTTGPTRQFARVNRA